MEEREGREGNAGELADCCTYCGEWVSFYVATHVSSAVSAGCLSSIVCSLKHTQLRWEG